MKIIAKSAPCKEHINEKIGIGTKDIEIQLLPNFDDNCDIDFFYKNILSTSCNVDIVHMPLESGLDLNFEYFTYPKFKSIFFKCCELSQKLANFYNHKIIIVVHFGTSLDILKYSPGLLSELLEILKIAISNFKDIEIAFENVIPLTFNKDNKLETSNGFLFDNVEFVNWLNNELKTNVFGTVLDTCHVLQYNTQINNAFNGVVPVLSMEEFFKKNKDTIKLIHLCDLKNQGLEDGEHGAVFSDENKLKEIIDLYYKYEYSCFVTLEVMEYDYLNCQNFKNQKTMLENILKDRKALC